MPTPMWDITHSNKTYDSKEENLDFTALEWRRKEKNEGEETVK